MIEQLELNWSRFDSEWKSIIQDKKSSYELCHNQSRDTYSIICQDKDLIYFNAFRRRAVFDHRQGIYGNITFHNAIRWRRITRKVNNTTVISNIRTICLSNLACNRPTPPQMVRFVWIKIVKYGACS